MRKQEKRKYILIATFAVGVIFFIIFTLSGFYKDIQQRVYNKRIETTKEISLQGSAAVEKKLEGLVNTLFGLAEYVHEKDISDERNIEKIKEFLEKRNIGFQRMGIADADGNAKVTNGKELNISDRKYFQTCMKEKRGSSEIRTSDLVNKPVCIIAVPVLNDNGEAIGVIYGVTEIGVFEIYDNTILESGKQYIQLVDPDGKYVLKEASTLIGKRDNIFDGINSVQSEVSAEEIKEKISNDEQVYTEITDGISHEILYFTPLKLNSWCVVTAIDYEEVTDSVDYILGNDVYVMVAKVVGVIILLFLLIMYYSWQERKQIKAMNEQLILDENIMRIAAEKSGVLIMSYGIRSRRLRFINSTIRNFKFPDMVENAPEAFAKSASLDETLKNQIRKIFESVERGDEQREFPLNVTENGKERHFRIQLTVPPDKNGVSTQCIAVMEDVTEKEKLREKADRDPLTGLYNRSGALEKIKQYMQSVRLQEGRTYAYMILDMDNFKVLNDTLGHQMGDKALLDVAEILQHHFRSYDIVCRLGGDEFLVFMKDIPENVVARNIESLLKKLVLDYEENGNSVRVTASAGVALVKDSKVPFQEMYRKADDALYQVKQGSKNSYRIYDENRNADKSEKEKIGEK